MDAGVIAALIGAAASIVIALWSGVTSARNSAKLTRLEHELEEEAAAEKVLARYREPLLEAAYFLQSRIGNIQHHGFLGYASPLSERSDAAILSTLYRVAHYFGWREILRQDIQFLDFRDEPEQTRVVADLLAWISAEWADDAYGTAFMLWLEEQRAIGALMVERQGDRSVCISYASFCNQYKSTFLPWFERIDRDLRVEAEEEDDSHDYLAETDNRLAKIAELLRSLVERLDPDQIRFTQKWRSSTGET